MTWIMNLLSKLDIKNIFMFLISFLGVTYVGVQKLKANKAEHKLRDLKLKILEHETDAKIATSEQDSKLRDLEHETEKKQLNYLIKEKEVIEKEIKEIDDLIEKKITEDRKNLKSNKLTRIKHGKIKIKI